MNQLVRFGVLGLGRAGSMHALNLKSRINHAQLIAVASDDGYAPVFAQKHQIPYHYDNLEAMLSNDLIDAVAIVSSTKFHPQHILAAIKANKHVFSEKPLGSEVEDCITLLKQIPPNYNKVVTLGFMRRYDASYQRAKALVDLGKIGKPYMVRCVSQDPVYNLASVIKFAPTSGGQFVDMSAHDLDLINWFLDTKTKRVFATGGCYLAPEFAQWNDGDHVGALLEMENGTYAMLQAGRLAPHGNQTETEIYGTKGILRINANAKKDRLEIISDHKIYHECDPDFLYRFADAYVTEMQSFVDNIINNTRINLVSLQSGLYNLVQAKTCQQAFVTKKLLECFYPIWKTH